MNSDFGKIFYVASRLRFGDMPVLTRGLTATSVKVEDGKLTLFDKIVDISDILESNRYMLEIDRKRDVVARLWDILGMSDLPKIQRSYYEENGYPDWTKEV